jgi:thiol-disulfide isomerase/thioredoxin
MKRSIVRVAVALAFSVATCTAIASPKQPALSVTTLDGATFDLSAQRGKWVVVNFWATWCSPCIKEMPDISKFVESRNDVAAIGLEIGDEEKDDIVAFVQKHPVKYPIAIVPIDKPPADFGSPKGLPTTYLIAPDGSLAKKFTGPVTAVDIGKAIDAAPKRK